MPTHIRRMVQGDTVAVAELCTQLGYPATADDIDRRAAVIDTRGQGAVLVAEEDGRVVGWIHVIATPVLETDLYAEIAGLIVDERCRSRGVGLALLHAAEAWARDAGCRTIRVRSRIARERAHAFYERHGFRRLKTQHAFEKSCV
jgi:GNAT superfamily N-acetyltransferase